MKKIIITIAALLLFNCKAQAQLKPNQVNVSMYWFYEGKKIIPENQLWFSVNGNRHYLNNTLSYTHTDGSEKITYADVLITVNKNDKIEIGGKPLYGHGLNKLMIMETDPTSKVNVENGKFIDSVCSHGDDVEYTTLQGISTFTFITK